ncbi:NUP188 [Lepeophtheirus salmonis]|uniref:NUP188 n=1 Tax=Lepeophtheirus salmonis TaxID=72036 RepID=A0A7R8CHU1_LEPSM|nr:NUP188 [Lepeophtheirus salmonis]CAF2826656.1 NUP188 [Lepeophtheirus salmonis]
MSHSSLRGLFTLVSGVGGVDASTAVLKKEFEEREKKLFAGVSFTAKGTSTKRKNLSENFESFLSKKLGSFLDKGPEDTWDILSSYLSGDFRGTRDSLKVLINQEHLQKPLIVDIWQFYRAERLYLLQVLKQILSHQSNASHKHYDAFKYLLDLWKKDSLKESLISQLKSVFEEEWNKSSDLKFTWIKYNLREKVELLQLILLHFHGSSFSESVGNTDLKCLFNLFRNKGMGPSLTEKIDPNLVASVGQLQSLISIYLMNLPKLTLLQNDESVKAKVNDCLDYSLISSLGSSPYHGPIMLAWMLSRYLRNGELSQPEISIGERAVQLRVLHYLNSLMSNDVITNQTVKSIAAGVCYSILSILITVFDPDKMGLGMDIHNATQLVLTESLIASNFWKQGFDTGLGLVLGGYLTKFPVTLKPVLEICTSLAEASPESSKEQVSHGAKNVNEAKLSSVTAITKLTDKILHSAVGESIIHSLDHFIECFFILIEKFVQAPSPPIDLLANCVSCLSVVAKVSPQKVWDRLASTGLFPYVTRSNLDILGTQVMLTFNPGVIGALLAQQECVDGEYPLTNAFLDLLLHTTTSGSNIKISPSLIYIVQEMLPSFQQWRFAHSTNKPIFGQKILKVCFAIISSSTASDEDLSNSDIKKNNFHPDKELLCEALLSPAPCETLFNLVGIGDKAIQSILEDQSSWECGLGTELVKLVDLRSFALPFSQNVHHQPQPHFLLTIAHYIYHFQNPNIPISAVKLLSTVAGVFPMSLLACLGQEAEAFRDVLISRLESHTEDVRLKIAIVEFFSACIENQPGLVQLLIGGEKKLDETQSDKKEGDKSKDNLKASWSSMDKGCLKSVLTVMENDTKNHRIFLWIVAVSFLKKQKSFWKNLSSPLFDEKNEGLNFTKKKKLCALILRIFSAEIFAFGGKVDAELKSVLENFVDEKSNHLNKWNKQILEDNDAFLLGAWKTFLVILTKDQPISISPVQCHFVAKGLIEGVKMGLSTSPKGIRITTSLSEMTLILTQKWMTKCSGNIDEWMKDHKQILEELDSSFDNIHVRTKSSILALAHTALKISSFKIEKEDKALASWIQPAVNLVLLSIKDFAGKSSNLSKEEMKMNIQVPILAVNLLKNLIQRLSSSPLCWTRAWRESILAQSLISILEHCLRHRSASGLIISLLKSEYLVSPLGHNPFQTVPSSSDDTYSEDWYSVFRLSLRLAANVLRIGKQYAVNESITAVSLLQDRVTSFLNIIPPMNQVKGGVHLELTSSAVFLHIPSFTLLQTVATSTSFFIFSIFIIGYLLLSMQDQCLNSNRVRRLSSTDQETMDHSSPETVKIQNCLLDIISSCLKMFRSLSPDMSSFVSVEDLIDPTQWESLVTITFSSPTFDEEHASERFLTYEVSNRDKQLLRRELGAELGSFIESMRRFVQRSSKSPIPQINRRTGGTSPASLGMHKSYDCFIKMISSVVLNVYK